MPTISQLPCVDQVSSADEIPVSQNGATRSVSVGTLLESMQPAIIADSGRLLGRVSLGPGGPEPISIGEGLLLNEGTLAISDSTTGSIVSDPFSITSLTQVVTIASSDLVAISQGGTDRTITYQNLLDGQTIDLASAAGPVSDTDTFWVGQSSSTMYAQTFGAVWSWIKAKLPGYRRPVVEIAVNTTLDGTVHNDAILVCSQPVTLTPAFVNMGNGFTCTIVNLANGNVTLGTGIVTSSGTRTLSAGQAADLQAFTFSGGSVIFAAIASSATSAQPPGQVTGLAVNTTTSSSVMLTWQAPAAGETPTGYTVNYRMTSVGGTWTPQSATGTSLTVSGLAAATQYDFEVIANSAAGSGIASLVVTGTTLAAPTQPPGEVTGLTAANPTASSVNLAWTAPSTGGAVASYTVQYRTSGATGWNVAATGVPTATYTVTGLAASTSYDFQVFAVNSAGSGTPSAPASATTIVAAPGLPTGLTAGAATGTTVPLSWIAPASGGAVSSYSVRWSPHNVNTWTTVANISGTSTTITGLTVSTSYDFQVQAVNTGGNSGWTAAITAATTSGGNYLLTAGVNPATGSSWPAGTGGVAVNANDNSVAADGSHTVPASVLFGWSLSNSVAPTSGLAAAAGTAQGIPGMTGHNVWYQWINVPASTGAYYFWAIAKDAGGSVVATYVSPSAFAIT